MAQDIIVDNSSYPTAEIEKTAHENRELGLGYSNLGALLMCLGLPYDSKEGRDYAAAITALMHGQAYWHSIELARHRGAYANYETNREPQTNVLYQHCRLANELINLDVVPLNILSEMRDIWRKIDMHKGATHGVRNSQVTLLAPTGTIAFLMDCDTTGVEPDIALVKYKKLVGGGLLKIVNNCVPQALKRLGYDEKDIHAIVDYINEKDTIEGAPELKEEHLSVFDCAFKAQNGIRTISPMGHVLMMAAIQPFLSGAISKTVNLPENATIEDIEEIYLKGWSLGLKDIAVYRDNCKKSQPLNTGKDKVENRTPDVNTSKGPFRRRLPADRMAVCHKFEIQGHEGYIHVGLYDDGTPGEIFVRAAKEGSTVSGLLDTIATLTSLALQNGVPLENLVDKFAHVRFEPSGFTKNPNIPMAKSLVDYIFRYMGSKFLSSEAKQQIGLIQRQSSTDEDAILVEDLKNKRDKFGLSNQQAVFAFSNQADAPACIDCGAIMIRNGSCYKCMNCGATSGCS
jgi:ribonucleoside-diphosphate reductase alpha chain